MSKLSKLLDLYKRGKKISCITAYDASMSKYLESSGVDIILVGDSLGQVIKGEKSTHGVTIDEIAYHARCVRSGLKTSILMVDLPKNSYNTKSKAYKNSHKFISTKLADLIKIEIDTNNIEIAKYLIEKNIPLCAHIGLLPQTIKSKSGYRKYGKSKDEAKKLYDLAVSLDKLGAKVILIECLENSLAKKISQNCSAPVIGIGSGNGIDGQVAVIYDLLGISFNKIDTFFINDKTSLDKQITKFIKKLK